VRAMKKDPSGFVRYLHCAHLIILLSGGLVCDKCFSEKFS
jgi:hypothetical protein